MNNKLFETRRARGLSRDDLAKAVGISPRTIEKYEQGRAALEDASYKVVVSIAKKLGTDPEKII